MDSQNVLLLRNVSAPTAQGFTGLKLSFKLYPLATAFISSPSDWWSVNMKQFQCRTLNQCFKENQGLIQQSVIISNL